MKPSRRPKRPPRTPKDPPHDAPRRLIAFSIVVGWMSASSPIRLPGAPRRQKKLKLHLRPDTRGANARPKTAQERQAAKTTLEVRERAHELAKEGLYNP
eukprot:6840339-Pyramimonas_sp.AAC.1